jgi:hypothetical protein
MSGSGVPVRLALAPVAGCLEPGGPGNTGSGLSSGSGRGRAGRNGHARGRSPGRASMLTITPGDAKYPGTVFLAAKNWLVSF